MVNNLLNLFKYKSTGFVSVLFSASALPQSGAFQKNSSLEQGGESNLAVAIEEHGENIQSELDRAGKTSVATTMAVIGGFGLIGYGLVNLHVGKVAELEQQSYRRNNADKIVDCGKYVTNADLNSFLENVIPDQVPDSLSYGSDSKNSQAFMNNAVPETYHGFIYGAQGTSKSFFYVSNIVMYGLTAEILSQDPNNISTDFKMRKQVLFPIILNADSEITKNGQLFDALRGFTRGFSYKPIYVCKQGTISKQKTAKETIIQQDKCLIHVIFDDKDLSEDYLRAQLSDLNNKQSYDEAFSVSIITNKTEEQYKGSVEALARRWKPMPINGIASAGFLLGFIDKAVDTMNTQKLFGDTAQKKHIKKQVTNMSSFLGAIKQLLAKTGSPAAGPAYAKNSRATDAFYSRLAYKQDFILPASFTTNHESIQNLFNPNGAKVLEAEKSLQSKINSDINSFLQHAPSDYNTKNAYGIIETMITNASSTSSTLEKDIVTLQRKQLQGNFFYGMANIIYNLHKTYTELHGSKSNDYLNKNIWPLMKLLFANITGHSIEEKENKDTYNFQADIKTEKIVTFMKGLIGQYLLVSCTDIPTFDNSYSSLIDNATFDLQSYMKNNTEDQGNKLNKLVVNTFESAYFGKFLGHKNSSAASETAFKNQIVDDNSPIGKGKFASVCNMMLLQAIHNNIQNQKFDVFIQNADNLNMVITEYKTLLGSLGAYVKDVNNNLTPECKQSLQTGIDMLTQNADQHIPNIIVSILNYSTIKDKEYQPSQLRLKQSKFLRSNKIAKIREGAQKPTTQKQTN